MNNLSADPKVQSFATTTGEGWGLTYDDEQNELVVSDGSHYLLIWDPVTLQEKRRVPIMRMDGKKARNINELEYWNGKIVGASCIGNISRLVCE